MNTLCIRLQSKYKKTIESFEEKIVQKRKITNSPVTVSGLEKAEKVILKGLQSKHHAAEKSIFEIK